MQRLIEKHSVGLIFGILLLMFAGYLDMRSLWGSMNTTMSNMNTTLDKAVERTEKTSKEQLLRTDEIDYVDDLRDHGALLFHKSVKK